MTHILIIDDEAQVRLMLRKLLESEGYTVTEASNGIEGVKCYHENPADLIITDIIMPDKQGIQTIRELKKEYPDVKIIALSGGGKGTPDGYLNLAKQSGAMQTIEKPIRKGELLKAIKHCMTHILIIDDEQPIRLMLRKLFESEGYTVTEASNGMEGIESYRENPANLIITDLLMPEKEGLETIIELKKKNPAIKIIAMSGGGRNKPDKYLHMAKQLGAMQTFEKPIRKGELLRAIKNLI
jgi:CheY-like chemotaxis protein